MTAKVRGEVTAITALRVSPKLGTRLSHKVCRRATIAAEHWVVTRNADWWSKNATTLPRPLGYDIFNARHDKFYRRVLPIFKKYLP